MSYIFYDYFFIIQTLWGYNFYTIIFFIRKIYYFLEITVLWYTLCTHTIYVTRFGFFPIWQSNKGLPIPFRNWPCGTISKWWHYGNKSSYNKLHHNDQYRHICSLVFLLSKWESILGCHLIWTRVICIARWNLHSYTL